MDLPALVRRELGDEDVRTAVSLGDEDVLCVTRTRVLLYRGEGLLSDESVGEYPLDVDRVEVSAGRRKTTFTLSHLDGSESFSVPRNRGDRALTALLEGVLRVQGVVEPDESVRGVYRFSELTLIVTDGRLVKLIGAAVWAEEYERFDFADVTGLEFEAGSVATQIVLAVDGRPQRIKAPNDEAPKLRQTLQNALFEFYGVDSVAELNESVAPDEPTVDDADSDALTLDYGIDPLVGGEPDAVSPDEHAAGADDEHENPAAGGDVWVRPAAEPADSDEGEPATAGSDATVEARLDELTAAVERQNDLLERHQRTLEQLIEELRQGR
jgi:hypothetical protein